VSKVPARPELENELADLKNRVRSLEALFPDTGPGLIVSDGISSDTVDPTTQIIVGPGLELTSPSAGEAEISADPLASVVPTLTASSVNPTLGAGGSEIMYYVRLRNVINLWGNVAFGTAPAIGTGRWSLSLPALVAAAGTFNVLGIASMRKGGGTTPPVYMPLRAVDSPDFGLGVAMSFVYPGSFPGGALDYFGSGAGWTLEAGDVLQWAVALPLATP
jgi:hypothetical protein